MTATPQSWTVGGYREAKPGHSDYVQIDLPNHIGGVRVYGENAALKAQLIVRAVNVLDETRAALEAVANAGCVPAEDGTWQLEREAFQKVEAVLAKLNGGV